MIRGAMQIVFDVASRDTSLFLSCTLSEEDAARFRVPPSYARFQDRHEVEQAFRRAGMDLFHAPNFPLEHDATTDHLRALGFTFVE